MKVVTRFMWPRYVYRLGRALGAQEPDTRNHFLTHAERTPRAKGEFNKRIDSSLEAVTITNHIGFGSRLRLTPSSQFFYVTRDALLPRSLSNVLERLGAAKSRY